MKTLLLMRHAKSSWKNNKLPDKERPLNKRGEKDAPKMSELLCEKELYPQAILTSTALRCRLNASAFLTECCQELNLQALEALYMAEPPAIIDALKNMADGFERVMVIGHNPGLETLLQQLTGEVESLPTASVAYLEIPVDHWNDITLDSTVKKWEKWKPKDA
jgi:phosphohistidine phosphatase